MLEEERKKIVLIDSETFWCPQKAAHAKRQKRINARESAAIPKTTERKLTSLKAVLARLRSRTNVLLRPDSVSTRLVQWKHEVF